jgi:hypothetical protein
VSSSEDQIKVAVTAVQAHYMSLARELAADIAARRAALAQEEEVKRQSRLAGARTGRGTQYLTQDRKVADGMLIGLAYLLGRPGDLAAAERLVEEVIGRE